MTELIAVGTAAGAAAVGGTYFAFSAMVMPALARRPPGHAVETMRAVNRTAERGLFIIVFGGAAILAVALCATSNGRVDHLVGGGLSLASTAITLVANVPLNRRLERGLLEWSAYSRPWLRWNTLRALVALAAVAVLVM
jgi:uncharacterized membrane protein